jgi:hypothetical protein
MIHYNMQALTKPCFWPVSPHVGEILRIRGEMKQGFVKESTINNAPLSI